MANQYWDAALYDSRHAFVAEYGRGVIDLLEPQAGERILDVGCGTGALTHLIAQAGAHVVGFDASSDMIAKAREQYPGIQFDVKDVTDFAYDAPFDAIFSNATLHWVQRAADAVACMSAALGMGGRLVVELGGHGNVACITQALQRAAHEVVGVRTHHQWYFPSIAQYTAILERNQLEVTSARLFDRSTTLEGDDGLRNWYRMFGEAMLAPVPAQKRDEVFARAEHHARPLLHQHGAWVADYRRLRIVARKV